jgi:hypothetical protein
MWEANRMPELRRAMNVTSHAYLRRRAAKVLVKVRGAITTPRCIPEALPQGLLAREEDIGDEPGERQDDRG